MRASVGESINWFHLHSIQPLDLALLDCCSLMIMKYPQGIYSIENKNNVINDENNKNISCLVRVDLKTFINALNSNLCLIHVLLTSCI